MNITKIETNFKRKMFLYTTSNLSFSEKYINQEKELINIYPDIQYQEIIGFGGAFTEAGGYTLSKINDDLANKILEDYFSENGLNYSFCRTHIGSCDFCCGSYSYIKNNEINTFSIEHDKQYLIPMIKKAMEINKNLKLLASPWSPPTSMKDNNNLYHGGKLLPEYYNLYAQYLVKYLEEYLKEGILINYMTIQNEPNAVQPWESCIYSAKDEGKFANKYLYPYLISNNMKTKLLVWDHNKQCAFNRFKDILKTGGNSISGIAVHWYSGDYFEELELIRNAFPDKLIIHSEGCTGYSKFKKSEEVKNGEIYAHDLIGDLNAGINGFIDWNMVLDYHGGPNHKNNYCNAPIMVNKYYNGYIKNLTYYYIGHFSKYIKPGAKRIAFSKFTDKIEVTAFKNFDNSIVVVLLNRTDSQIHYKLNLNGYLYKDRLDSHCIVTFVINI